MGGAIDLHMHSYHSDDGEFSPSALVQMCAEQGIYLLAITDHNTVKGVEEGIIAAQKLQRRCFPGIEIDCTFQEVDFHVLGYAIHHESRDFDDIEGHIRRQSVHASKERLRLVKKLGFDVTAQALDALAAKTQWPESWTGEMIAEALLQDPRSSQDPRLRPYVDGHRSDNPFVNFYWDYCAQGKPCHVKLTYPSMGEVIELIHRNGGKAVLAHPGVNLKGKTALLDDIIPLGIDGLEAYSSYHDKDTAAWFSQKAAQHGLVLTQGSDFHGKTKPSVKLGCTEQNGQLPQEAQAEG